MIIPGLVSVTFRKLSPATIISLAVDNRLASIEWGGDIHVPHGDLDSARTVKRACSDAGISISAYGSYYRAGIIETAGLRFDEVLATALELGTKAIRIWAGKIGSVSADAEVRKIVISDLHRICAAAAQQGIEICLEFHAGTLSDNPSSTLELIREVNQPNLSTFWQPPNGLPKEESLAGLAQLLPKVRNLHVFHWWPDAAHRLPLADGADRWRDYLNLAATLPGDRHASLEFVRNDDPAQLRQDAQTLHSLLGQ